MASAPSSARASGRAPPSTGWSPRPSAGASHEHAVRNFAEAGTRGRALPNAERRMDAGRTLSCPMRLDRHRTAEGDERLSRNPRQGSGGSAMNATKRKYRYPATNVPGHYSIIDAATGIRVPGTVIPSHHDDKRTFKYQRTLHRHPGGAMPTEVTFQAPTLVALDALIAQYFETGKVPHDAA